MPSITSSEEKKNYSMYNIHCAKSNQLTKTPASIPAKYLYLGSQLLLCESVPTSAARSPLFPLLFIACRLSLFFPRPPTYTLCGLFRALSTLTPCLILNPDQKMFSEITTFKLKKNHGESASVSPYNSNDKNNSNTLKCMYICSNGYEKRIFVTRFTT